MKSELDPKEGAWFDDEAVYVDLGLLGIAKDYGTLNLHIPFKRKRRKTKKDPKVPFTDEQKVHNKKVSSVRVRVEHAFGGLKRYRFLSDRLRCRNAKLYSRVAGVCAGLWNFNLTN